MSPEIKIGSEVQINQTGQEGRVNGIYEDANGISYHVRYATKEGLLQTSYFHTSEITLLQARTSA